MTVIIRKTFKPSAEFHSLPFRFDDGRNTFTRPIWNNGNPQDIPLFDERGQPIYFVRRELADFALRSPVPEDFDWDAMNWPTPTGLLIMPRGIKAFGAEIQSIHFTADFGVFQYRAEFVDAPALAWYHWEKERSDPKWQHEIQSFQDNAVTRLMLNTIFVMKSLRDVEWCEPITVMKPKSTPSTPSEPIIIGDRYGQQYFNHIGHHASPKPHTRRGHPRQCKSGVLAWVKQARVNPKNAS